MEKWERCHVLGRVQHAAAGLMTEGTYVRERESLLLTASMQVGLWSSSHMKPHLPITCINLEVDASPNLPDKCPSQLAPWGHEGLSSALVRTMRY